jgi:tetratricopeptide (TPR) repeat protein
MVVQAQISPGSETGTGVGNLIVVGFGFSELLAGGGSQEATKNLRLPSDDLDFSGFEAEDMSSGKSPDLKERKEMANIGLEEAVRRLNQGIRYYYQGMYQFAKDELEKVKEIFPTPDTYSRLGSAYYRLGDQAKALEYWEKALALDPKNSSLKTFVNKLKAEKAKVK